MQQVTIALAKGRLAELSVALLGKCGVEAPELRDMGRKLIFMDNSGFVRLLFVKPSDVPTYVEHGVADMGIAGKDTLMEANLPLYEMLDTGLARCRLVVAGFKNDGQRNITVAKKRVATKYANIARNYYAARSEAIEIIKLNGSIELAPMLGLSDVILDIVESGRTLDENGLSVLEEVCEVSARVVVNRVSLKTKRETIRKLIGDMEDVLTSGAPPHTPQAL